LYAAGIATTMVGTGLFTASMVFWGRRNAYLRATEGRDPWPFGIGATAGYLSAAGVGAVLTGLGSYALVFQPGDGYATRKEKLRRGLALAGVIVGGNLMFFGGFLGGFSLGHHLYRRDTTSALAIGFSLTGPPVSGRF
jgi:hypothetical protein